MPEKAGLNLPPRLMDTARRLYDGRAQAARAARGVFASLAA
jgi:hypothetical protein